MKRKDRNVDPTNELLKSVGISSNPETGNLELGKSAEHQNSSLDLQGFPSTSPPHYFPCIVLRLSASHYCYFPIYISAEKGRNHGNVPNIIGKYRELIIPDDRILDWSFQLMGMMKMTKMEFLTKCRQELSFNVGHDAGQRSLC